MSNAQTTNTAQEVAGILSGAALAILEGATASDQVITLHPSEIFVDPTKNGRHPSSDNKKTVRELANDIEAQGQLQPIIVRPWTAPATRPDGSAWSEAEADDMAGKNCELVFGYQRYAAVVLLLEEGKVDSIKAVVRDMSDIQSLNANISENLKRKDVNMLDRAHAVNLLLESKDENGKPLYSGKEAAKVIGVSPSMITKLKSFKQLIPALQSYVATGDLTVDGAYELASKTEAEQEKVAASIAANLTELEAAVASAGGGGKKKATKKKRAAAPSDETTKKAPTIKQVREVFEFIASGCKDKDNEGNVVEPAVAPSPAAVTLAKELVRLTQGKISGKVFTKRLIEAV